VWVGVALGWFGWTVLRGRRARFGVGLLLLSAGWIAALNVMNPEAVVVRINLVRALEGHPFDAEYHATLSADAVPALVRAAERLPSATCADLMHRIGPRWVEHLRGDHDWRSWTVATDQAERSAGHPEEILRQAHCTSLSSRSP
jgi:hypothetical protein